MLVNPGFAAAASVLANPARAAMLAALQNGALTEEELATQLEMPPDATRHHLRTLIETGMTQARRVGGARRFSLVNAEVAHALAGLAAHAPPKPSTESVRSCGDHLGGPLAVAVADALESRRMLVRSAGRWRPTAAARALLVELEVTPSDLRRHAAGLAPACWDAPEGGVHVGGGLGRAVADHMTGAGYLTVAPTGLELVAEGRDFLARTVCMRL